MTLTQLQYAITIAGAGSMNEAARAQIGRAHV